MDRNELILQLRCYGNMDDVSGWTDEQMKKMLDGYQKKRQAVLYSKVCPYFTGVRKYDDFRQWIIGCSRRKGCDVTPLETRKWACECAQRCFFFKTETRDYWNTPLGCRFYSEAQKERKALKQTYICKCGKTFEKDTTADTTGYRLGGDFGAKHECFGCPFVVSLHGVPYEKIIGYECRASRKINYRTTADLPRTRDSFHVGRIHTLDLDFAREIWNYSRNLPGLDDSAKEMDKRGVCYGSDGRYCLSLYFSKTKAGVASLAAISDRFFEGKPERPDVTEEQEKQRVLEMIRKAKKSAKKPGAALTPSGDSAAAPRPIERITMEINFYKAQTAQNIIEIGKRLIEAKQQLPHGEWLPWLRDQIQFSEVSAQRFMRIAQEFSNTSTVTDLPYTKLLALLQVPEDDRDDFIQTTHLVKGEEKTVSEMSKRELEQAIKERDEARNAAAQARERESKADREAAAAREKSRQEYKNYMDALVKLEKTNESLQIARSQKQLDLQKITELEDTVKELESRPIEVAVQEPGEDIKKVLRAEGAADASLRYEKELAAAQRKLEEAKAQARQQAGLERDDTMISAGRFLDLLDSGYENFLMILNLSSADVIEQVVRKCVSKMREKIDELENKAALIRNGALMDQEFSLPPADGREG
ncbi:DUF3102 domain-containing protein [Caproicibacter fermentans]|nr:DUF3102 domain-containing protein [Caproicibacter fermentans]